MQLSHLAVYKIWGQTACIKQFHDFNIHSKLELVHSIKFALLSFYYVCMHWHMKFKDLTDEEILPAVSKQSHRKSGLVVMTSAVGEMR